MITASHSQLMAQYNQWMNSRLYALCASLPEAELRKDRGAFFKSIYTTLNHIAWGDLAFLSRLTGDPAAILDPATDLFGSFNRLREERSNRWLLAVAGAPRTSFQKEKCLLCTAGGHDVLSKP